MKVGKEPWYKRAQPEMNIQIVTMRTGTGGGTVGWKGTYFDNGKESALYGDYISLSDFDAEFEEVAELLARQAIRTFIIARKRGEDDEEDAAVLRLGSDARAFDGA